MSAHFFSDTIVMTGRSLRHVTRSMDTIITVTIMPIAFMLLFVYVFGGAIQAGTDNYVNYCCPASCSSRSQRISLPPSACSTTSRAASSRVPLDADRPLVRAVGACSDLTGVHGISVVVIVLCILMGFRSSAGAPAWLAVAGILYCSRSR